MSNRISNRLLYLSVAVVALLPSIARAQVEEVIVTAEKHAENSQDVPIAIVAFSADQLEQQGVNENQDLSNLVPTLKFNAFGTAPFLRGVGNVGGGSNEVLEYVDGVIVPNSLGYSIPFNNVDTIEVDKGPQGTLFGRDATGGVIRSKQNAERDTKRQCLDRIRKLRHADVNLLRNDRYHRQFGCKPIIRQQRPVDGLGPRSL